MRLITDIRRQILSIYYYLSKYWQVPSTMDGISNEEENRQIDLADQPESLICIQLLTENMNQIATILQQMRRRSHNCPTLSVSLPANPSSKSSKLDGHE